MTFYRPHDRVTLDCGSEQITKQAHKQECDINYILSQYQRTGILTHFNPNTPQYLDLPADLDYQASLHLIQDAKDRFAALPAAVRDHFRNDPALFMAALNDPGSRDLFAKLGLLREDAPKPAAAAVAGADAPSEPPR